VREQIRALVPSAALESGALQAEGTITRVEQRFRLKLVLRFGEVRGERSIESNSCGDLAGAAAVAVGLLLQSATQQLPETDAGAGPNIPDDDRARQPSSSAAGGQKDAAPKPSPSVSTTRAPARRTTAPRQRSRSWRVFVLAPQLAVDVGPLPQPALGVALAAGLSVEQWSFAGSFELPRGQQLPLSGPSGAGAELERLSAELWTCRSWRTARLDLFPCLLVGMERLVATGTGQDISPQSQRATWLSVGATAMGTWRVAEWFALAASVGAKLEGARPTIRIEGVEDHRQLAPAALIFRAGPMWIF
jgi:hypothetical protein